MTPDPEGALKAVMAAVRKGRLTVKRIDQSVERILAAQAKPRSAMEALVIDAREQLDEILRQTPLDPRSTADYQPLLEETGDDEESHEGEDDEPDDPAA